MVYQVLKKEILDLDLKPGQVIKENEICERFSVSRTPVRDALRMLQEQGFVVTVPYRGIFVTLLSLSNIKQMIYMRVAVETIHQVGIFIDQFKFHRAGIKHRPVLSCRSRGRPGSTDI